MDTDMDYDYYANDEEASADYDYYEEQERLRIEYDEYFREHPNERW
jgi:hypothetical protein